MSNLGFCPILWQKTRHKLKEIFLCFDIVFLPSISLRYFTTSWIKNFVGKKYSSEKVTKFLASDESFCRRNFPPTKFPPIRYLSLNINDFCWLGTFCSKGRTFGSNTSHSGHQSPINHIISKSHFSRPIFSPWFENVKFSHSRWRHQWIFQILGHIGPF